LVRGPARQRGGLLLEALVGILIFTLGVLGLLALQARAVTYTSDAGYRGEAAYLANDFVSRMWSDSRANLPVSFAGPGGQEYDIFKALVDERLPGASGIANNPSVDIIQPPANGFLPDAKGDGTGIALTATGTLVTIIVRWRPPAPDGTAPVENRYTLTTIIAHN
jgi:type IV pilus assembly protein PilV